MIRINSVRLEYENIHLARVSFDIPEGSMEELWALFEEGSARGGLFDVMVALPRSRRSRRQENLLYATARPWWIAMGYDNREGWMMAKLKFGVSTPWFDGFDRTRPGEFVEYDHAIWYVVSESDYNPDEAGLMIDRLREDAMHRGIDIGRVE